MPDFSPVATLLTLAMLAPLAGADPTKTLTSDQLFKEGVALESNGQWTAACTKYEGSRRLAERPGILGRLANCYEKVDRLADAWGMWSRLKRHPQAKPEQVEEAERRIAALDPTIARLRVTAPQPIEGLVVKRGDRVLDPAELDADLRVNGGEHVIVASAPGYERKTWSVTLVNGQQTELAITLVRAPVVEPGDGPPDPSPVAGARPLWAWGLAGGGVVALGVSAGLGLSARNQRDQARDLGCSDDLSACPDAALSTAQSARGRADLASGFLVGGVVLAGAGLAALLLLREAPAPREATAVNWSIGVTTEGVAVGIGGDW